MMRVKNMLLTLTLTVLLLPIASAAADSGESAGMSIGYVDLQRALHEVEDGQTAKAALQEDFESRQQDLNARQDRLKGLRSELETQGMMMKEDVRRAKAEEYQRLMMELQESLMEHQNNLAEREAEATAQILSKMEVLVRQIAKEGGFTHIFERNRAGLIVAPTHMDITNDLIRRYNQATQRERRQAGKKKSN